MNSEPTKREKDRGVWLRSLSILVTSLLLMAA
ncbi:uncharacterized protein METZ01_LOCUS211572, partial [marine metagenome]